MKRLFNKHRDRRPMVKAFFDHCAQQATALGIQAKPDKQQNRLKTEAEILSFFDKLNEFQRVEQYLKDVQQIKIIQIDAKKKFNGTHVQQWVVGISGKSLGLVMKTLRESVPGDYYEWILATEDERIKEEVLKIYNSLGSEKQDSKKHSEHESVEIT